MLLEEFGLTESELKNLIELVAPAFSDTINYKTFFNFLRQNIPHMDVPTTGRPESDGEHMVDVPQTASQELPLSDPADLSVSLFSEKITPLVRKEIHDALDDFNARHGLMGSVPPRELLLILVQSSLKVSTQELKEFVEALPRAETSTGEETILIEDLKRLIN